MHENRKLRVAWLIATPLVAFGCAAGDEPNTAATSEALTSVIPTSTQCNQGVGASKCLQAPPFEVMSLAQWTVDGTRGAKEYAGGITLPFMTDAAFPAGAVALPPLQANGTVYLQRVTMKGVQSQLMPRNFLYVFLEDIHVWTDGTGHPLATVNLYIDNDRFDSPDSNVHASDRRYVVDLDAGVSVAVQQPSGVGSGTTWSAAPVPLGIQFAAGGCAATSNARVKKCKGELRIPLNFSATVEPGPGLAPGIGFMARTANLVGMSPDLPVSAYAASDWFIKHFQTVLFTRPRGFDLAITTWNVRRFEAVFQSAAFATVKPEDIGQFLAKNDIVAIQEGWDRDQVTKIFDAANLVRAGAGLPKYNLYGPIDHQPAMSEVTETVVDGFTDTQGGLWVMSHLPLATEGYHVFTSDSCRGEDCWKAKGVQWVRLMLQDPGKFDPKCRTSTANCNKPPSGDDFIDVFNTHLQANEPLLCKLDSDWADIKLAILALLASFVDPVLAFQAGILTELVEADLNCGTLTDRQARASQLQQMDKFISQVAATDRSSLVLGDFNIDGKPISGSEYRDALVALEIASANTPDDDTVSALPPGGFDIRHGDILRERTDVDFSTGRCTGTFIDEAGGTPDAMCNAFAGGTDADERLDYILVRPPQLISQWQGYPRWFISAVDPNLVWTSPFPSLSAAFSATPLRLSDHKPITAALSFSRLSNPPKYNSGWKHTIEQRVISVNATDVGDCLGCGEVDPFARLESKILPSASLSVIDPTTECTDNQNPVFGVNGCMSNWVRNRNHTPPNETSVSLFAKVWDDDDTSGNDVIGEGTTSTWNYAAGTLDMSFRLAGNDIPLETWVNTEAVPMSRCAGIVEVCHRVTITEITP